MYYYTTTKRRVYAGFWLLSALITSTLQAKEPELPAPLKQDTALTAPAYTSTSTPKATIPALSNWLDVNQRVSEIGGWMFYATEGETDHSQHHKSEPVKLEPQRQNDKHEGHPL